MTPFRSASLGAGEGSTAMVVASVLGFEGFPPLDKVTFADTGDELPGTYAHVERFGNWLDDRGVRLDVVRTTRKGATSIFATVERRVATGRGWVPSLPVWTVPTGRGAQFCTAEFKSIPLDRATKKAAGDADVEVCIGFTAEELGRVKGARKEEWPENWRWGYPLLMAGWNRHACRTLIKERLGWPVPPSACSFCPHRRATGPASFEWIKSTDPETWDKVRHFDEMIRESLPGLESRAYLTKERRSIEDALVAAKAQGELFGGVLAEDGRCDEGRCFT